MAMSNEDIVRTIRESQRQIEEVASSLPEADWSRGVYEAGWNAKQLLCHVASSSPVSFLLTLARNPAAFEGAGDFDIDAWNAQQVATRQDKPLSELLAELRSNCERDISAVQATPDDLLSRQIHTPWGAEGALADIIIESIREHTGMHLTDLRAAVG